MKPRVVEILLFEGCPNVDVTMDRVRDAIAATGGDATLRIVHVASEEDAVAACFLGSPSVRVDGRDVEPGADGREDFGLQCRIYAVDGGLGSAPPPEWIRAALVGEDGRALGPSNAAAMGAGCCSGDREN
jgi:hypothetical protein